MITKHVKSVRWKAFTHLLVIATLIRNHVKGQCFGGTETYEKTTGVKFNFGASQGILTQPGTGITRDCTAICRQTPTCAAFTVDYENSRCQSFNLDSAGHRNSLQEKVGSNFFEKICLRGVSNLVTMCGDRLWAFERVVGAYLEDFDDREERNIQTKTECEKLCLFETSFTCRSAEFDETAQICRLSREDRRSQPSAFRRQPGGSVDYLENQCVRSLPDCRYNVRQGNTVISMDELQFAASQGECEALCDQARGFTCRSFTYAMDEKRCYLSGDDSVALNNAPLITKRDAIYAEKQCSISQCEEGLFTFEKVTGHFLRSAQQVGLAMATSPGVTLECGARCLEAGADCPAFSLDYNAMKCFKLDRNTQGRGSELSPREGQSYFEKMCLRGNVRGCEGRAWAFERRPGKELRGHDDAVMTLIQSRRDCMEACLAERRFSCRSAEYDTLSASCRLSSEDRRTQPTDYVDAPATTEYIENQCLPPESRCNFKSVANSYPRYLDLVLSPVTNERDCERLCYDYSDFICRSFSYYQSAGQCFISSDDRSSAGNEAMMSRSGTNYYERDCQVGSGPPLPPGMGGIGGIGGVGGTYPSQGGGGGGGGGRCNVGTAEFEKVTGYELSGRPGFTLFREPLNGIAVKCTALCRADPRCHGFNLDYNRNDCISVEADSEATRIDLRAVPGVSFFQGICLRGNGCGLAWTFERHINQELRGFTNAQFPGVTKTECADLCLEETSFVCRSATYNTRRHECRLSADDRFTQPQAFQSSLDNDYIENLCATFGGRCVYRNQQRDRQLIYTDKSLSAFSDSSCQHACDVEREFACRAYTFLSQTGITTAQCLLSGSSGTGVNGFQSQSGALYAEKECTSFPPANRPGGNIPLGPTTPLYPLRPGATLPLGPNPSQNFPIRPGQYPPERYPTDRYPVERYPSERYPERYPSRPTQPGPERYPYRPGGPVDADRYPSRPGGPVDSDRYPTRPGVGGPGSYPPPVGGSGRYPGGDAPSLVSYPCRGTLTYEKIAGATYGGAQREPIRTRTDIGISGECLVQCADMRQRCLAVSVENLRGGRQRCYALSRAADEDNGPLQAAPDLAYFQKICLAERPTCSKAWVFTRVPGYELSTGNGMDIRDVHSRRQCQEECLREKRVVCRSATYHARERVCRISTQTRRTQPQLFKRASSDVDYMENECAPEPPNCEYADMPGRFLPYTDRFVPQAFDVAECRRLCDQEREFSCRSFNYHISRRECFLSSDDTFTADRSSLVQDRDYFYSEHDSCSNVRVDCTQADMLITFLFGGGFEGRVYATGNPQACFEMGNGQGQLVLRIPMGTQCGTVQQGRGRYVNHVVIQQNPVIMQETDKTVRVECSFDASDQTVSYAPSGTREQAGGGISVTVPFKPSGTNIVTNTAPTPNVRMRIVTRKGQEAAVVGLGDELQLKIDIDPTSAFGIFVRNLEARTDNGEILTLIDNVGCPRDPNIFPALQAERGTRDLFADFKAFRFPSTATVNFVATVQFCQDVCEPIRCSSGVHSFGRRRRSVDNMTANESSTHKDDYSLAQQQAPNNVTKEDITVINLPYESSTEGPLVGGTENMSAFVEIMSTGKPFPSTLLPTSSMRAKVVESSSSHPTSYNENESSTSSTDGLIELVPISKEVTAPSTSTPQMGKTTRKVLDPDLPNELPLQLRLVVGEDTMMKAGPNKKLTPNKYRNYNNGQYDKSLNDRPDYADSTFQQEAGDYVCTPKSTVVALTMVLILLNASMVLGFVFFYRYRKKQWNKMEDSVNNGGYQTPTPVPEVHFRSVYGRLQNPTFNRPILGK